MADTFETDCNLEDASLMTRARGQMKPSDPQPNRMELLLDSGKSLVAFDGVVSGADIA